MHEPSHSSAGRPFGLIAGWGRYPVVVAEALRQQGYRIHCAAIRDHADPALARLCHETRTVRLGQLGGVIRYFASRGATQATMAGKVHKVTIIGRLAWLKHLPDWKCVRTFFHHFISGKRDRKDDTLLLTIVRAFAQGGVELAPATDFVPEILVKQGCLTRRTPTSAELRDIEFGWQLAKELGRVDVGQSVAVSGRAALAIEAIEGTDECIRRAGRLCPGGGFTVVKVAKPAQDMRFDVPTIGMGTLRTMVEAGARVLAIEADKTIVIDQQEAIDFANRHRIAIVSLAAESGELSAPAA